MKRLLDWLAATLCWACVANKCGMIFDRTCSCCRAGHTI